MRAGHAGGMAAAVAGALLLGAAGASAETVKMAAKLAGTGGAGSGQIAATYDTGSKQLSWEGTYAGLSGPATMAHFHGPADPGKNAPVLIPSPAASPIKGTATLTDAQEKALLAGQTYFNIHTAANPGGEIRGQVVK